MSTVDVAGVKVDTRHYIGGKRVASKETYTNTSPIDGSFLGEISRGGQDEVNAAVEAARSAFPLGQNLAQKNVVNYFTSSPNWSRKTPRR